MLIDLREKGWEGEEEGEKHQCERETSVGCLLHVSLPGIKPATQIYAQTGNETYDLLVYGRMLPPTEPRQLGWCHYF